ncbi:MAG: PD-(D/E)XK nuclease family protein [bacterium]|nr:PD-(D/E)XK nuclease family protein [bacterium]
MEPLRQSTIYSYLRCPYQHLLKTTDPSTQTFRHPSAIHGTVIHQLIRRLHAGEWEMDVREAYAEAFDHEVSHGQNNNLPVRWKDDVEEREAFLADAVAMLEGYRSKDYNRSCRVLMAEAKFTVKMGRQTLTGTIDQVRENQDGSIELVDFKTGRTTPPDAFVAIDYQLSIYAYALRFGTLLVDGSLQQPHLLPDRLTVYFLRHHIPYKRATNGKSAGEERGDPRISTTRSLEQLRALKDDVSAVAKMIKSGCFPRSPDPLKCGTCPFADTCRGSASDARVSHARLEALVTQLKEAI